MRAKRRTFRAYLVEPFKQIRFGLHVVAVCLVFVVLLGWLIYRAFSEQYLQVIELFSVADSAALVNNEVFTRNGIFIGAALLALTASTMFVVFRQTHRMYGPMVSIHRFVNELKKGHFAARIRTRNNDEFQNLVAALNGLAEELHKKFGSDPSLMRSKADLDALDERLRRLEEGVVFVDKPDDAPESSAEIKEVS